MYHNYGIHILVQHIDAECLIVWLDNCVTHVGGRKHRIRYYEWGLLIFQILHDAVA